MKRIIVTRKKKFACALMPYWVIPGSKQAFKTQFGIYEDIGLHDGFGQPVQRIDPAVLDANGVRIGNGGQIAIDLDDSVFTVFASTMQGSLSNEVYLQGGQLVNGIETYYLNMTTKGGVKTVGYPWFE
jgi:hypothetical protein